MNRGSMKSATNYATRLVILNIQKGETAGILVGGGGRGHQREVGGQAHVDAVSGPKLALALVTEPPVGKNGKVQAAGRGVGAGKT